MPKKPSYRALVKEALNYASGDDHKAAATAWLNAADAAPRHDEAARLLCGQEAVRAFNAAWIEPAEISAYRERNSMQNLLLSSGLPALPGTSLDVFYWPLSREGEGRRGRTRGAAFMAGGGIPVICIEGVAGYIALSHVLVISEGV